jgi:hypothetical protein
MAPSFQDQVTSELMDDIVRLEEDLIEALRDRDCYRLMAQIAIGQIAELTRHNDRLRVCLRRDALDTVPEWREAA